MLLTCSFETSGLAAASFVVLVEVTFEDKDECLSDFLRKKKKSRKFYPNILSFSNLIGQVVDLY